MSFSTWEAWACPGAFQTVGGLLPLLRAGRNGNCAPCEAPQRGADDPDAGAALTMCAGTGGCKVCGHVHSGQDVLLADLP
eukprot:15120892-Heterocapsa_arctica.AAC.1